MKHVDSAEAKASVLLTGASGFVGGALLPALREAGVIRCLVRDATQLAQRYPGEVVEADLGDRASLVPALEGMDEVYYLVHSMEPGGSEGSCRARPDRGCYVEVARAAGVSRTIYLYRELLEPLMEGLHSDLTVEHNDVLDTFGVEPTPFATAARQAMEAMPDVAQPAAP